MNVFSSQTQSDTTAAYDTPNESSVAKMTADILPACSLLGIIAGFAAFVAFGQAVLPALIAAVVGALLGLFFACEKNSPQTPGAMHQVRK